MRKIVIAAVAGVAMLSSCKTSDIVSTTEVQDDNSEYIAFLEQELDSMYSYHSESDSTYIETTPGQAYALELDDPCDSVTGKLREMSMMVGSLRLSSKGNRLTVEAACAASVQHYRERHLQDSIVLESALASYDSLASVSTQSVISTVDTTITKRWSWMPFFVGMGVMLLLVIVVLVLKKIYL